MSMNEKTGDPENKKNSLFLKIKRSFKIGKKSGDKNSTNSSIAGKSETSQRSGLKYVNLIASHKLKKKEPSSVPGEENVSDVGEAPKGKAVGEEQVSSTSSKSQEPTGKVRLDVEREQLTNTVSKGDTKQTTDDEEEQLRLYKAMHEIRKQMILKEKQFQEEKLEFYKLQLEADNIIGPHKLQE